MYIRYNTYHIRSQDEDMGNVKLLTTYDYLLVTLTQHGIIPHHVITDRPLDQATWQACPFGHVEQVHLLLQVHSSYLVSMVHKRCCHTYPYVALHVMCHWNHLQVRCIQLKNGLRWFLALNQSSIAIFFSSRITADFEQFS